MAAHIRSTLPPVDIPPSTSVPAWVLQNAARYGTRPALIDAASGQHLSYSSLVAGVQRLASGLYRRFQRYPLEPESTDGTPRPRRPVVCLYSAARIEFPVIVHAVLLAGGTITTADKSLSIDKLTSQFEILLPDFIVTDHDNVDDVKFAASRVGAIKEVFVLGKYMRGHVSVDELLRDDGRAPLGDVTVDYKNDVAIVLFDGDNNGHTRGVMHSHSSFTASVAILGCPDIAPVSRDDIVCCCHQMASTVGLVYYCGLMLREGATSVILPQFNHKVMLDAFTKYKVTVVHVTPGTAEYLATDPNVARSALYEVRRMYCSGAPLREGLIGAVMARSGIVEVREGFGPAEAPIVLSVRRGETLPGYVGQVCPNTEVQIRDILFGGVLEPEMYGEICVRGPQIMKGYLHKLEPETDQLRNGWLHTGHIGQIDESGNFSLLGRMDDLICYDSFQIAPVELERVVRQHPDVDDAVVVGMDNHGCGHVPRAYVIKKPGADVMEAEIRDYVAEEVLDHKRLRGGVVFIGDIPKSTTGEPRRYKLQQQANRQELDISLGECAQWPPDGDYIDDMRLIAGRGRDQSSLWGQMLGLESFNFSSPSAAEQGSGVFSHSSLKFDSALDGFITTRDKNKTKTPEAQPPPLSPIRKNDIDTLVIKKNHIPQNTPVVRNNHTNTVSNKSIDEKMVNVVRFDLDQNVSEHVQSEGGVGVVSEDIPDLTPLTLDCQPPMSTSTPKHSPRHRSKLTDTPVIQVPEPDITTSSYDQSSLYPHTDTTTSSKASLSFEKALQENLHPEVRKDWVSPGRPGLVHKKETSLREAMNLACERSRRNMENLGGNNWKSTGDLSKVDKDVETSDNSQVQGPPARASGRLSRIDTKSTTAQNIRMRATQYGQHVRSREMGLHPARRNLSSYRESFNRSGSSGRSSGSILYSPRSKSSDRSSYLSSSRAYPSFSLTNRFDLV